MASGIFLKDLVESPLQKSPTKKNFILPVTFLQLWLQMGKHKFFYLYAHYNFIYAPFDLFQKFGNFAYLVVVPPSSSSFFLSFFFRAPRKIALKASRRYKELVFPIGKKKKEWEESSELGKHGKRKAR